MIRSALLCLCLSAALLPIVSCKKHEIAKESNYTLTNSTGQRLTVDVYNTKEDYTNNTNRSSQYFLEANQDLRVKLKAPGTLYLDWYSDNYSYNNWDYNRSNNVITLMAETPVAIEDDHVYLTNNFYPDTSRSVLLNGSGTSSTWEFAVPFQNGTIQTGKYRFVFRKDFSGRYTFTNGAGNISTRDFHYYIQPASSSFSNIANPFYVVVSMDDFPNQPAFELYSRRQSYPYEMTSRDTLYANFYNQGSSSAYYPAARQ